MSIGALERKVEDMYSRLMNIIRVGRVTLQESKSRVRVEFEDRDSIQSYSLLVISKGSKDDKDYWMPTIDEPVLCLFLPIGIEQGFVVGPYYPDDLESPETSFDRRSITFKDGTVVRYDKAAHAMSVDIPTEGSSLAITVNGPVTVNAPKIDLGQPLSLEPIVLGDKLAAWITDHLKPWLNDHHHGDNVKPAVPFQESDGGSGGNVYSTKNKTQ